MSLRGIKVRAMDRKKLGSGIGIGAAIALTGALAFGGYTVFHGVGQSATADTPAYSGPVATSVAAPAQDDAAAQSIYDQQVAQAKADAEAAAAKQLADQQAAAKATADAAKKIQQQSEPVVKRPIWVVDSNPGNQAGGYWDTTPCGTAGATYDANNQAVCVG